MGWQFTKTTSLDEVKELFLNIRNRITDLENLVIMADNCCSVKRKLSEMFGPNVAVKLDLFHAVQRLTKKLPKKHPMIRLCTDDFRLIFRTATDLGHKCMDSTADSKTILDNMDRFLTKWKECELDGWKLIKEADLLTVHIINKGCLSNLPKSAGTNRNERLHRHLRPHFSHTRLGLPMALSIMTILLHQYNSRLQGKITGAVERPIQYEDMGISEFQFGIANKDVQQSLWGSSKCKCDLNYGDIISTLEDYNSQAVQLNSCVAEIITIEDLMKILQKSLHLSTLVKTIASKSASSLLRYQFFPFMSSVSTLFFGTINPGATSSLRLNDLIESWKMKRHQVKSDGNCRFLSVAIGLHDVHTNITSLNSVLPEFNFDCINTLCQQLRLAAVTEWKENKDLYFAYMTGEDIDSEADLFKQDGFFSSTLSDSALTALANAISMQFIVFTAQESYPVVHIPPRQIKCGEPIYYLAFSNSDHMMLFFIKLLHSKQHSK